MNIKEEAEKFKIYPKKFVSEHLSYTERYNTASARSMIKEMQEFLDTNELEDAKITFEVSGCMGCGGCLDYVSISSEVNKTDEELQVEINNRKATEAHKRAIARETRKKRQEFERSEYERLKKKFER